MADIKYLIGVKVGARTDGSAIVLAGATEHEGLFTVAFQPEELGRIVCDLLRLAANPEVAKRAPAKQQPRLGGVEARPFQVEGISVAKAPMVPGTALCIDFPGIDRVAIGLSLDESEQLAQQLQDTARSLRSTGAQRSN